MPNKYTSRIRSLKHGAIPVGLSASSARRFQIRCNGFNFYNNALVFNGKSVVPTDRAERTIKDAYNQKGTVGKGINQMMQCVSPDALFVNFAQNCTGGRSRIL